MSVRLRHVAAINPPTPEFESLPDTAELPFLPLEAIWPGDRLDTTRRQPKAAVSSGYTRFREGDILLPKITPTFQADRTVIANGLEGGVGAGTTELHVIRAGPDVDARYLRYLLSSKKFLDEGEASMIGVAGQKRVPDDCLRDLIVPVVDLRRQRAIADDLDSESARIDALIEKKERIIDILHQRLDVVVIGLTGCDRSQLSAPPGWTRCRLKHLAKVERGRFNHRPRNDPDFYGGEYPFVQTGDIRSAETYITEIKQSLNERGRAVSRSFPSGTILMGIAANVGDVAITSFETWCPDSIVGFLPRLGTGSDYLYFLLKGLRSYIGETSTENTQENTNIDRLGDLDVLLPRLDIQTAVVTDLQRLEATVQRLSTVLTTQIDLLHEHRQALITAAVTGQLEISGVAA